MFVGVPKSLSAEATKTLNIYLDADRTRHAASATAIEMGLNTALDEVGYTIQGFRVNIIPLDHRGNTTRSKLNMRKAFDDPNTLFVMAGLHSPPLIKNRTYINDNRMLTLVPWAAGGPITRHPSESNWVFRLSIDDSNAGVKISEYAINQKHCKNPHLLLEKTPWGESNLKTMSRAIDRLLKLSPQKTWFNWGVSESSIRIKLRKIKSTGADCILFVGNANDGETLAKSVLSFVPDQRLPIFSHWGITGGAFHEAINAQLRDGLDLTFIQTCFSFLADSLNAEEDVVFKRAQKLYPELVDTESLEAPAGFVHAYDLVKLVLEATNQFVLIDDFSKNRSSLKYALENLKSPVRGLLKTYLQPFSLFSVSNPNAHEALGLEDYCMAQYGQNNEILILP